MRRASSAAVFVVLEAYFLLAGTVSGVLYSGCSSVLKSADIAASASGFAVSAAGEWQL